VSRFTNPRRWAAQAKRKKFAAMTENAITPDEAYAAMNAIVLQTGHELERVYDYDYRKDVFRVVARSTENKLIDILVRGETVAKTVAAARTLAGVKKLLLPSDLVTPAPTVQ
jgi:hypothetical protein